MDKPDKSNRYTDNGIIIFIFFFIMIPFSICFGNIYYSKIHKYDCCKMYHSNIKGIIKEKGTYREYKIFSVGIGRDSTFEFLIEKKLTNENMNFEEIVRVGDSVIKEPQSENIKFIKKNGDIIEYRYKTCCDIIQ